ncbi:hypothetical protein PK98_00590 [Croceibacterium mercuriale]|uniref:Uncharacterized protein n=1 Tax=Croceibacterium mercuriale TaxID=1572751 RepID=A0A0B2BUP0_9SPHN|nr:hypothetical protein [Croceibacterium mercuriale]KHL25283.1 hypothetical protein PK98_00590 [Croceibacterium mercuriale]
MIRDGKGADEQAYREADAAQCAGAPQLTPADTGKPPGEPDPVRNGGAAEDAELLARHQSRTDRQRQRIGERCQTQRASATPALAKPNSGTTT